MPTIEDALREVEDAAALLQFTCSCAMGAADRPEPAVFSGLADLLARMEARARAVRGALDVHALGTTLHGV